MNQRRATIADTKIVENNMVVHNEQTLIKKRGAKKPRSKSMERSERKQKRELKLTKKRKLENSKVGLNFETKNKLQAISKLSLTIRSLLPINYHIISGLMLFDDINRKVDDSVDIGVFSFINFLNKITSVGIEKENGLIGITVISKNQPETSSKLFQNLLLSLGDLDAKELASSIELFFLKSEFASNLMNDNHTEQAIDDLLGIEITFLSSRAQLSEEILKFLKGFSDDGFHAFVLKGKRMVRCEMETIEMIVNKKLTDFLGYTPEEWAHHCLRYGLPEFISPESYYQFWKFVFDESNGEFREVSLRLLNKNGSYKYVTNKKCQNKVFFIDGEFYIIVVQPYKLSSGTNLFLNDNSGCYRGRAQNYEYMESLIPFLERFYPDNFETKIMKTSVLCNKIR